MPLDNEKLKKVYSTLKECGYEQDYNTFVKGFSGNENYGKRKQVYDLLSQNGAQIGKNYAEFMQKLYTPSPKQTQVQQPRVNRGSMVRAVTDPLNARGIGGVMQNINKVQGVVKKAEKEKANGYQPRFDGVTKRNTEAKIPTLADMKPMPTFEPTPHFETEKSVDADGKIVSKAKPKQIFDGSGQPKYVYQDSFTGKTYDPNDSDPHTQEMIKRGEDAASYVQDAPMPKVTDNDLVGLASSIDKRMHEIALQRNAEAGTSDWSGLDMPRGGGALVGNWYTSTQNGLLADEEYKTLGIAQGALARAHKMVEEAEKSKREGNFSGFIKGAGRGFVDGVFDPETWDFGVSSLAEAGYIKNALDKFDSGQRLSKEEQVLLDAKAMEMAVNAFYGSDLGRGYKAGKVTAEAIPFMIEMAINPASGAGKSAASMLTRYALKRFGKKGLVKASKKAAEKAFVRAEERALAKGLSKSAAKAAGERAAARATTQTLKFQAAKTGARVLGDIAGASAMAATTGAMRTAADAVSRHSGDVKFDVDDKGHIVFAGHDKGDDWVTAVKKAFANTAIENYSEMFGAYFAPIGSFVGKAGEKLLSKIGLGKVTEMLGKLSSSDIAKAVKRIEEKGQFNGVIGEDLEEQVGGIMNALIVGDQTLDTADGTGVFNTDNQIDTFLGVGLMGGIFSAARLGGGLVGGQGNLEARRAVRQAGVTALKDFKGKELIWDKIKSDVDNASNDQLEHVVKNIVTDGGLSDENKKAALQYVRSSMHFRGFEAIRPLTKEEEEADAHNVQEEAVHNRGFEADAQERKDIAIESADPDNAEAQQAWAGVEQRIDDDATRMADAFREKALQMQHNDGSFHTATLKEKDEHGEGKQVFIVSGHVQMTPDGTMIDREASDKTIVIFDPSTGERKMIDPSSDFGLSSVDEPTTSEELEASIERERQGFIQTQLDDARGTIRLSVGQKFVLPDGNEAVVVALDESGEDITARLADGTQVNIQRAELQQAHDEQALAEYRQRKGNEEPMTEDEEPKQSEQSEQGAQGAQGAQVEGAPSSYEPDMELLVRNESGGESLAVVMGRVRYEGGEFVHDENGGIVEYYMDGEVRHEQISKLNDRVVAYTDAAQVVEEETPPAEDVQAKEEAPLQEEKSVPEENDATPLDKEELAPAAEEDAKEDNAMPMRDNGEEDWEATTPERAHTYIYNEAGLSRSEGNEFVAAQKDAAQRALNKAKSAKAPRVGTNIKQYKKAKAKHQEKIENAQRVLDYWNAVQDIQVAIQHKEREQKEAEDAKAHEEAKAQMQAEFEARKAARAEAMERRKAESLQEDGDSGTSIVGIQDEDEAEQKLALKEDENPQRNVASSKEESPTDFTPSPRKDGEDLLDYAARVDEESKADHKRKQEEAKVNTLPSDAQKEAGNYKKGHIKVDGLDITIEQPKGSIRTGKDASGKEWHSEMHNTYGYIRGTESVDGDHIDIFLSDNPTEGNVFVVDQVKKDGSFDEHKVMYGFADVESAKQAYLSNYEKGWQGLGNITEVSKDEFKKWIDSSKRKTKPFAEYTSVKAQGDVQNKKPTEAEDFTRQDLKELEDFQKNTDTTGRTAIDIDRYDAEDLFAPLKLDGKPSNLGVLTVVSDKITDPASQIAVYDYSDEIDDKTNSGWQKWGDLADEYNKTVDKDDKAQERGDTATLGFRTVDAAVKFSDWLNTDGQTKHQRDASLQYSGETLTNDTEAKQKATEAVLAALSKAGIEVVRATDEEVKVLLSNSHATTLRTPQGTIYGWSVNGKIYLTKAGINPDTPIHEYTHLWAEAMMIKNKKGWDSIKALLKDNPIWNEVVADANYSNIADNEDAVASEVLSRISGKKNAAKMEEEAQRAIDEAKGVFEKARATTILTNLKKALNSLWKWVSKNIFDVKEFSSISEVTDKVLYDLIHGTKLINDKSLIGVHNISEQKLRKVLKQGGFANPSIAVIDADKQVHDDYGEISLILPSRKVNKSTGKNVGTYEGDAWTPMYPIVGKQMSSDGSLIMHNDINSVPNEMQSEVRNALNRWLDDGSDTDLSYLYLFQQGKAPKMATVKPKYSNEVYKSLRDIMFGVDSVYNLTKGEVKNLVELYVQTELNGDIDEYNKANERRIAKYKDAIESGRTNSMYYKIAERNLEEVKKYGYPLSSLKTFADDVQRDKTKQGSKNVQKTLNAASQIIKDAGLEEDFRNWVEGLNNRYQTKEVIFDGFTPTGKRRYIPNTLENVSKIMKKQGRQASTGLGISFSNFAASVMKANGSLANIRKKKSKLTNEHKDIENFDEKWKEVYFDLAMKLQPNASTFDNYGFTRLQEAALEADPQAFLSKEYGVTLSKEDVRKLQQMVRAIQEERPAMYFETKFERPVTLNEFSKAVVPEDLSDDLQKTLRDNGIEIFTYKRGDDEDRQKATQEAAYSSDDIAFQIISNGNNEANNDSDTRFQIVGNSLSDEEKKIVETAKANNTYMKAPNGKPTNLSGKQWAQVRTKAFKKWFGDWEKAARIEKLRRSKAVKITEADYEGKYDLTRNSAKQWAKDNIRGEYMIADTGEKVNVSKVSINEVLSHGERDAAHLKSISSIGKLLHNAIFITETPNAKDNDKYESYRYYIEGVKIDGEDYTAKIVVGVKNGKTYYDHRLTKIEKGSLLDSLNGLSNSVAEKQQTSFTGKDSKLLSILRTNSSKVVDENGEPMVVYHGSNNTFTEFDTIKIGSRTGTSDGRGFYFTTDKDYANSFGKDGNVLSVFLSIDNPLSLKEKTITKQQLFDIIKRIDEKEFTADGEHWLISIYGNYYENGIEGTIREAVENEYPYSDNDVELVNSLISASGNSNLVFSSVYEITGKSSEIVPKGNGSVHYVVTIPSKIKSAVNNNGEFSTESDDIRFRKEDGENQEVLRDKDLSTEPLRDREAMRNEAEQLAEKLHTPINVVEDANEITHPNKEIEARRRKAKGWYNVSTGEVVVVLANHKDAADVAATISHEVIAHKGLRELVGEAHYDEFLDEVYDHLSGDLKREIDDAAGRAFLDDINKSGDDARDYKRHRRIAVDELFGSLAEKPFEEFSESERSLWQKIKEFANKLLDRFLDKLKLPKWFELGDNELRYILWRSKERLERGKEDPIDQAKDIVKREELGLTNEPLNKVSVTARNFEELAEQNEWNPKPIRGEEMVDLYEIAPKVTTHDYYLGTKAGFKLVKSAENVWDAWEKLKQQDGFRYEHSPKSDSEYLVNDETGEIYRISDHWGWVASCRWSIDDQAPSGFSIGKANIKDFERIKGNYVFTPEAQRREPGHETYLRAKENLERALKDDTYKFTAAARRLAEEKVRSHQSNAEYYEKNHESGDIVYRRNEFGKYIPYREMKHSREQWFEGYISEEEREIVERAQADGAYMKAPNGKPSNLNGKQWAQVRTKAFKKWFGDWEKAARIEKLRKSEPVVISGNEYKGKYELNRDSAKAWIKENLRGEYTVADTGERIFIGRKGVNKVTSHSMGNESHLKCLVAIPQMLEQSVFITEEKAEKPNAQYPTYRYYVAGLKIGGVDYTAKLTIGVDENGNKYYDHALTEIEKGKLLDQINGQAVDNGFMSTGAEPNPSVTIGKDTKLVSILQVNSSKVVDENGEPQVIRSADDKHTAYFLNIRHPLEASEDVVVSEIADKAVKEGYDGVHTPKGYIPFTVNQYKSAQRNNGEFSTESDDVLYRDSGETRDIWLDQSMGLQERTTAAAARLANNHRDNKVFMQDAMRAIGANLTDLRKAMRLQKDFDRTTAKRVYDLARILMEMGYLRGLNQQEVSKLLSVIKNSIGKQNIDNDVQQLMDLMVNHQLKQSKSTLESLEHIKGSKVNAKGVEVQGALDAEGQAIMAAMKAAKDIVTPCAGKTEEDNGELTAWGQALEDVQERMGSEDNAIAENAALEYQGMLLAQQWFDEIKQRELEEASLRQELNHAQSTTPAEERKGEAYKEYIGNLKQAIQQNKIDRAQAYMNLVGRLTESLRESIEGAKAFKLREKARISAIQRDANLDMEGRPAGEHYVPDWKARAVNNAFVSGVAAPLATMDQMLRLFGNKSANGEGYLYNRFERGFIDARQQEIKGYREKTAILDAKAAEIFGGKIKTWADLIRYVSGLPDKEVVFKNGGIDERFTLSQGNLMYIYMVNKMLDGRLKLSKMGLTSDVVEELTKEIDPRLIKLADWMQEDFLVQTRNEYNETHKRVFGASMAAIENYFPLKIRSNARIDKAEDLDNPTRNSGISTTTGSIIKRRRNSLPLDLLNADALNIILSHITEMEHWNAFVEYNRDLNTLRTYKHFRNGVENMTTIYGSGKELWKLFNDLCQITTGSYVPPREALDESFVNLAKGVTAAKVSFRLFTALKQFLSFPAYFPEVRAVHIAKCLAHPKESWDWCMENLPIFNERWNSRLSGDPRLLKTNMDWKMWRTRAAEIAMRIGMTPNAFVDALTVCIGARAMYMTRKGQYLRDGYTEEEADKRAKQDAETLYNQTQQSSEGAFLSRMQVNRGWIPVLFSIFRNSSMAYTRQVYDAMRNLRRNLTPGGRKESIAFMTKQYMNEGFDKAKAEENAKRKFDRQIRKDILRVATFGYLLQFAWNLGAYLPYMLFGGDDDEKEVFWQDVFAHSYFGSLEGLTGGDVISQVLGSYVAGNLNPSSMDKDMPLTSDLAVVFKEFAKGDKDASLSDMINLIVQSGIGVNPQSITDSVLAIMDACGDDPALANEATIFIARILQVPQSQIDKLYFDEVGLMGSGLSKYTPAQLAERYARYKVKRGHFSTPWAWDDDVNIGKAMTKANREIKERTNHMGLTNLNEAFAPYEEVYQKVDKQMDAYEAAKKTDYVKAANMMVEIQKDKSALDTYQKLKSMDSQLDKMAKRFLSAKSNGERQLYRKMIESYKPAMLKVLQAKGEAAQEKAMDDIGTLMEGFAEEQEQLYENQ